MRVRLSSPAPDRPRGSETGAPALEQVVEAVKALDMDEVREKIAAAATTA